MRSGGSSSGASSVLSGRQDEQQVVNTPPPAPAFPRWKAHLTSRAVSSKLYTMENAVKELREGAGLSQSELGDEVGVSRQTINSIERGRYLPSLPLALALARFFGTSVEEVFDEEK